MIFLFIVSFQANAIAGAQMMSDMMALSYLSEKHAHMIHDEPNRFPNEQHEHAVGHCSGSMEMQQPNECDPVQNSKDDCDKHSDCVLCLDHYSKAVLAYNFTIPPPCRFNFESDYGFSGVPVIHQLTLKPPKFI